jgi:hypothetical protein
VAKIRVAGEIPAGNMRPEFDGEATKTRASTIQSRNDRIVAGSDAARQAGLTTRVTVTIHGIKKASEY